MWKAVVCCVSDNAANITKAIKTLKWTHHPCLSHTANFFVRGALKLMKPTVDKVKVIVEFCHRSTATTEKLRSMQWQMGAPELKLKQGCFTTRWNTTFRKWILDSKDAGIPILAVINAPVEPLRERNGRCCRRRALFWSRLSRSLWRSVQTGTVYKCYHVIIIIIIRLSCLLVAVALSVWKAE